jgi:class 3 adenylate cyclase
MRPWTIDADDIHLAGDFDPRVLHRTPAIDDFLDYTRDDKFIVLATKGFGKTLLLKAKRIAYEDTHRLCIPQDSLLDKPVGDKMFRRDMVALYGESTQPWSKLWLTSIAIAVLKRLELTNGLRVSRRLAGLLSDRNLRSVLDHFVNLLDLSRNDLFRCANETDNQLVPRLRAINRSVAVFIDSVDEYFNKHIKPGSGRAADTGELSPSIWFLSQMALVEVAYELRRISHHLKVFAAVRKEAFARFAGLTPMVQQYRGSAIDLSYSTASLREIFVNNVLREKQRNLVSSAHLDSQPIEAFLGRTSVRNSFTGEEEGAFEYLQRHSLLRPRDLMTIGQKLSAMPPQERTQELAFKSAVHAASVEIGQEYLKEIEPALGGIDVWKLLSLVPTNVLSRSELDTLARSYDQGTKETEPSLGERGISALFNAGLLGHVQYDPSRGMSIQRFLSPGDVSVDEETALPPASHYLVRPVLGEILAHLNPGYARSLDRSNILGADQVWKERKKPSSDYSLQDLCVLYADIENFGRLMREAGADRTVREAFARVTKANTSGCVYVEVVNGDSVWIVHDDPNALLKIATRIKDDLFETPGNPELRIAADFGSVQLKRRHKKRATLAGGEAVLRVARIEPRVTASEIWVTEEFKRELEKKPTLYSAVELRPEEGRDEGQTHFNVRKPDEGDILVKLYRITSR